MSDWEGVDDMFATLDKIGRAADMATRELVAVVSAQTVARAQRNFVGSHAPGEPHRGGSKPNVVSGTARRSIKADPITRHRAADYSTIVGPRVKYGRRLELGYRGSRGYPYFGPAVNAVRNGGDGPGFRQQAALIWAKHMNAAT